VEVRALELRIGDVKLAREGWSLCADGTFGEGIHLISGEVGSGKSSLALILSGNAPPESGEIKMDGIGSTAIAFQHPEYHFTGTTVAEECSSWSLPADEVIAGARLAGKEGLSPFSLSRGEMKRLVISCILARPCDLQVLDEPFSSLDPYEKELVCARISARTSGITIIFTHEQEIFPHVDYLWEIEDSALVYRGAVPEALGRWRHAPPLIKKFLARRLHPKNISPEDLLEAACRT